jgi:DNA-binding MarR family transcriptional regulator
MNLPSYLSGAIFTKAYRVLRNHVIICLARYELTPTTWSLLGIVVTAQDGIRLKEVASKLGVKAPLVTMMAHGLIERELITRIPHPIDKRAKLLVMTQKGKRFVKAVENELSTELSYLLRGLTEDDLDTYKRVLDTIISNGSEL